jgi:hypothetical protein
MMFWRKGDMPQARPKTESDRTGSCEDRELYERIRARFMACLAPADVLEWHLVSRLIDEAWFIKRYARHQTVAVERRYQQSLEFQAQRVKAQNARKETLANSLAERMTRRPPEVADLLHLEGKVLDSAAELDEILLRTPSELQHNRALEKSMLFQEQLDKLIASATKRFNETLELFEHYREGLGQRLRRVAEEALKADGPLHDGNGSPQTEGPSIVPPEETDEVTEEINQFLASAEKNK